MLVGDIITSAREIWPDLAAAGDPDQNGNQISAATAYRWLNEALLVLGRAAKGIYDYTGIPSVNTQGMYQMSNFQQCNWIKFTKAWYDGWRISLGNADDIFRRQGTPAISAMISSVKTSNSIVVELFPQPITTAGATTLAGGLAANATSASCVSTASFTIPMGLALVTDGTNNEIIGFSSIGGNILGQLVRGLGGTQPTNFNVGANVIQLNIIIAGFRMPRNNFAVGNKGLTLDVPMGWEPNIITYMESRYREFEKEYQLAAQLRNQAIAEIKALASQNNMIGGPRQAGGQLTNETYGAGLGGGWFIS